MIPGNEYVATVMLALTSFFVFLTSLTQTHFIGIFTIVMLIATSLHQYQAYRKTKLEKRKLELEIKKLKDENK
jgi:cytochrome c biogenesis protein CcdA